MTETNPQQPSKHLQSLGILALFLALGAGAVGIVYSLSHWSAPAIAKRLKNPIQPTRSNIGTGMDVYMQHCQSCHGENGDGKGERSDKLSVVPANFTDSRKMNDTTDGELFWAISEGHPPMPAFKSKLTEEERWQVVDYIRTFVPKPSGTTSAPLSR